MKQCSRCGESKPVDSFCLRSTTKDGRNHHCRSCAKAIAKKWNSELTPHQRARKQERERLWRTRNERFRSKARRYYVKRLYGLEPEKYDKMLELQGSVCAICKCRQGGSGRAKSLAVDHDHGTGVVRGLLCGNCNRGVGMFKDSPGLLLRAANYLERVAVVDPADHQYCQVDC